jgi:branched-chain amino acid transport system ATP-binding protein
LLNVAVALVISLLAYRITQASKMVSQYPWIYERNGLFGWKPKAGVN